VAPSLCTIHYLDVNAAVPTLALLEPYQAILVYNDDWFPYADPAAVGDIVASYFDGGGRVVIALFADGGYAITGAWTANHYNLIAARWVRSSADSFSSAIPTQDLVPTSAALAGVTTIVGNASAWHGTQTVANGGLPVALWESGDLLAVTGVVTDANGRPRNRVDLNIQPTDVASGVYAGDAVRLLANALLYQ